MLLMYDVDDVIHHDHTQQPAIAIHDGCGNQVPLAELEGHLFLVHFGRDDAQLRTRDVGERCGAGGAQHSAQRDGADRPVALVDQEQIEEIVRQVSRFAQVVDGGAHVPVVGQRHHVALHEAPGAVLGPGQPFLDERAANPGQHLEDGLLYVGIQRLDDFDRIVRGHGGDGFGGLFRPEVIDDPLGDAVVQFRQYVRVERFAQDVDQALAFARRYPLQQIGRIRRVQRVDQAPCRVLVPGVERADDVGRNGV